ncbi:MAG: EamA family transporter, partial [Candidatus Hodarchaeales archaeon]
MEEHSSLEATTGAVLSATIFFGFGAVIEEFWTLNSLVDPVFIVGVLVLGVLVTSLGFLFFFMAVKDIGATKSGIFINLVPVFGTLSSVLLLGEPIYWTFVLGLGLIITGIFIINSSVKDNN